MSVLKKEACITDLLQVADLNKKINCVGVLNYKKIATVQMQTKITKTALEWIELNCSGHKTIAINYLLALGINRHTEMSESGLLDNDFIVCPR